MTRKITYLFLLSCILWAMNSCRTGTGIPDLKETYGWRDTKPFGGFIAKRIFQNSFPGNNLQVVKVPFEKNGLVIDDTASVYFSVSRNLFMGENDVESVLSYVYAGNTAFFSASVLDTLLLNKLFCKAENRGLFTDNMPGAYGNTHVKLIDVINSSKDSFGYFYNAFLSSFTVINDRYCRVVGYNSEGKVNCIVFFWGKGKLFLHTEPRAFSNYFLLTKNNYRYMQELVQVTAVVPQHVYWDDYYNKLNRRDGKSRNNSTLSELFKYPALKAAFWLLLSMLLLYILFSGKRRQRIIKEIKPNQNSSVAFTETIAGLYLQKHDNKSIAEKMITYFNEFIRSKYYLNASTSHAEMISTLSRKSGVPEDKTAALFNAINDANRSVEIDDYQLLSLNSQIQQFYKKKK